MKTEFGEATKRLATKECTRDVTGLKALDRNRPYGQIRSACGIVGLRQDGIAFDLDGYEVRKEEAPARTPTAYNIIGTCSKCGGAVQVPTYFEGELPPLAQCSVCGAMAKSGYGPTIATITMD